MIEVVFKSGDITQELQTETVGEMLALLDKLEEEETVSYTPLDILAGQTYTAGRDVTIYFKQYKGA